MLVRMFRMNPLFDPDMERPALKNMTILLAATVMASAALAAPATYVIDNAHTFPRFEYSHFGYSTQTHRFTRTSGTITVDRAANTGAVNVVIDAKSVDTGTALFNEHIQGEDFFDTARYPTLTYVSNRMRYEGGEPVAVEGDFTIKGVTRPVTLAITSFRCMPHPLLKKDACGANASAQIKRSDFNMGKHAPYVSDDVTLVIPVEAVQE